MFAEEFTILLALRISKTERKNVTYGLNLMHRCNWERDLAGLVGIKNLLESNLCLSDFG